MAFLTTTNSEYGTHWQSTGGFDPRNPQSTVSTYRQVAETDKKQKISLKLLKTKIMLEKEIEDLETGAPELPTTLVCLGQKPTSSQ
jgi:hypothetical protein